MSENCMEALCPLDRDYINLSNKNEYLFNKSIYYNFETQIICRYYDKITRIIQAQVRISQDKIFHPRFHVINRKKPVYLTSRDSNLRNGMEI